MSGKRTDDRETKAGVRSSGFIPEGFFITHIEAIKQVIVRLLVLHKQLKVLKHLQKAEDTCRQADLIMKHFKIKWKGSTGTRFSTGTLL